MALRLVTAELRRGPENWYIHFFSSILRITNHLEKSERHLLLLMIVSFPEKTKGPSDLH